MGAGDDAGKGDSGHDAGEPSEESVHRAGDDYGVAGLDSEVGGVGDLVGGHELALHQPGALHLRAVLEPGFGGARAEGTDSKMSRSILFGEGFREAEHIGFAGVVRGHVGSGKECCGARNIDEAGIGELEEDGDESLAEIGQDSDIEVDQSELAIGWD